MRIAVIGGGPSGIVAAKVLRACGHEAVLFERSGRLGGVWAVAYPQVRLQNIAEHYRLSDFPWPFAPDLHPTREQIVEYLQAAVAHYGIEVRLRHEVLALREDGAGWQLQARGPSADVTEPFDYVLVATGQFTGEPQQPSLPGREGFAGEVISDRAIRTPADLALLDRPRVAVVGFGKSAVDMATFAAQRGAAVQHVFREPRWLLPRHLLGIHAAHLVVARLSTAMLPCWVHPSPAEQLLHERLAPLVPAFWSGLENLIRLQCGLHGLHADPEVRRRMRLLTPRSRLTYEMRSAVALAPDDYFPQVRAGRIEPHRGEIQGLSRDALLLTDGRSLPADLVILSTGYRSPRFPFLPAQYRALLESEPDGPQLYRHLLHPRIPRLAFAGFNHGFLHFAAVEVATLWLCALLRGDLILPEVAEMERRVTEIRDWKRRHTLFEPSRSCGVNTRIHQYLDVLLQDLGLDPYRKPNPLAELFVAYSAQDYAGLVEEYERVRATRSLPRLPLPLST
ncbi:MAG: NAD(P)/FAD-dependent oxidoreductase [Polyangia bacterium]